MAIVAPLDSALPLGDRLVEVALVVLAENGIEALTLRNVARRAGVSHAAPARHFRGLSDLRAEVAARGFRLLREAMERTAADTPEATPFGERLARAGRAYVECVLENPGLFALMFRKDDLDRSNATLSREAPAAFEALLEHVRAAQHAGWQPERDARLLAGSLWAAVHGVATLWAQGAYQGAIPHASLEEALNTTLQLVQIQPGPPEARP